MNQNKKNTIWPKWVLIFAFIVIITGFCFSFIFPFLFPQAIELFFTEITGMTLTDLTENQIRYNNFISGVGGAVMMGWGTMIAILGFRLIKDPKDWIWTSILASLIIWYVSDTAISLMAGSLLNVILNSVFLLLALPPLVTNKDKIINSLTGN